MESKWSQDVFTPGSFGGVVSKLGAFPLKDRFLSVSSVFFLSSFFVPGYHGNPATFLTLKTLVYASTYHLQNVFSETYKNHYSPFWQECPKCHVTIEKDGGCNHMVCRNQNCKAEFCWVCLGPWEPHGSAWYLNISNMLESNLSI